LKTDEFDSFSLPKTNIKRIRNVKIETPTSKIDEN